MFGFLWRLFKRHDPFVFRFHDGERRRAVDPIVVEQVLTEKLGSDWLSKIDEVTKPMPDGLIGEEVIQWQAQRKELQDKILDAIDAAFEVKPFKDGKGLTVAKRCGILAGFNRFCMDLVTLARPFAKPQSRDSPGPDNPPTASGLVSTSAVN